MNGAWTALLPAATVGTDRQPGPWPLPAGDIGALARQAADTASDPATGLLRAAAVLATCALAGAQGPVWTEPLPPAAPEDSLPALDAGTIFDAVVWTLQDGPTRVQHEALLRLGQAGLRLPARLLPQALELGRRSIALRVPLSTVLGERGLWLAAQRGDWAYATGASDTASEDAAWSEGTLEQRRAWFARARAADPGAARERLQATLPELPARERVDLVSALVTGIGPDDEPLLDQLRVDRSREVRQAALQLLLRLPAAAHPQRAAARMARLLTLERGLLRKRWVLEAPAAVGDDWKADRLDTPRPQNESLGERAWWLYQLVRQIPLSWWTSHTGMSAAELLAWAAGTDWTEALLRGWAEVLFAAPDDAWCDALLDHWPPALRQNPARVLGLLAPHKRDRHLLREARTSQSVAAVLVRALEACPPGQTLSAELSVQLALTVQTQTREGVLNTDYGLRGLLADFACAAHADSFALLAALPRRADETPSCAEALLTVERIVNTRRALLTLKPRTP